MKRVPVNEVQKMKSPDQFEVSKVNLNQFHRLIKALFSSLVLRITVPGTPYFVYGEPSAYEIDCKLFQMDAGGEKRSIRYWPGLLIPLGKTTLL